MNRHREVNNVLELLFVIEDDEMILQSSFEITSHFALR